MPRVQIHILELPNGLRALMVEQHQAPVVTVEVWYHVGSRNEPPGQTGFAHLFEHLMFDGTKTLGPHFSDYIVKAGGIDNAYTTTDTTTFWETMPSSNLPVALWLEADRMRNLDISPKNLQNERQVVNEERRQRFENPPYGDVMEKVYQEAFRVNPYRHLPIGATQDLNNATVQQVRQFYDAYYEPENATVVITGEFSTAQADAWVKKYFGAIPRGGDWRHASIPTEPEQTSERVVKIREDVALPAFVEAYHIPADGTPDSYPLEVLSKILSAGDSALIYRDLVYQKQLAFQAESTANFSEDPNLFFVFAVMNTGHSAAEGEAAWESILEQLKDQPPTAQEMERARNQIFYELAQGRDTSRNLAEQLGYNQAVLNRPEEINSQVKRFQDVTPQDVQRVAEKYFGRNNLILLEIYPQSGGQGVTTSEGGAR